MLSSKAVLQTVRQEKLLGGFVDKKFFSDKMFLNSEFYLGNKNQTDGVLKFELSSFKFYSCQITGCSVSF